MRCHGHNYITIRLFCEPLSLCSRTHSFRRDDSDMIVFRFVERAHAEHFRERFGGELIRQAQKIVRSRQSHLVRSVTADRRSWS